MGTRSYIAKQIGDDRYLTISCQLDGYPEEVGATLIKAYSTPEKVDALLALGDLYCLCEKLTPDSGHHDFNAPQPGVTVAYQRDDGCSGCEAVVKTFEELSAPHWPYMPTGNPEVWLRNLKDDLETGMIQYSKPLDLGELMDMEQADAGLTLN